ncbi:class I adenylate-forming enzyme family protein [Streptomyces sp. NPDC048420]|uniref:class I adenylate-forming enzyme family protein n=1 Tax=Streptomyces sp. NPDC048420 TaxID=3155755 RepID=UPI00341DFC26
MIALETLLERAAVVPDTTAVGDGRDTLTWSRLAAQTCSVRSWLTRSLDPADENRAVVLAGNSVRVVVATAALTSLGVPWVGIDPARDEGTIAAQLEAVNPTFIVVDSSLPTLPKDFWRRWPDKALLLDVVDFPAFDTRVTHYLAVADADFPPGTWHTPRFLALGFTSGTTGVPKLFVRRKRTENQRVAYLRDALDFGPSDSFLITSPLAFASGHVWVSAALALGGSVRLGPADSEAALEVMERERLTGAFFVPPFLEAVLEKATTSHAGADLSALRFVLTGGRHLSPRAIRQTADRLGDVLHLYYATTETGINTMAGPADLAADPYSAGRCMPGVTVRAVDPVTAAALPAGQVGQLAIESAFALDGYVHRPLDTVRVDGRSHVLTSDYGYVAGDGRVYVTARSGGDSDTVAARVDFVRAEGDIKNSPAVRDACVAADPERMGAPERAVIAAVVLRPDLGPVGRAHALTAVREKLRRYADTATVLEVTRIPYNNAGKVSVRELMAHASTRLAA